MDNELQVEGDDKSKQAEQSNESIEPEPKEEEAADNQQASIGQEIDVFIQHIDSLATSFPLTILILQAVLQNTHGNYRKFIEGNCEIKEEDGRELITVEPEHRFQYSKLVKQIESGEISLKIVPRSLLVALVSQFDSYLGRLLRALFYLKPELLNSSEKALTLSQLMEFKSVENAKEYILEKEIETVLRKSHAEQFDWLEKKFGIHLRKGLPVWPTFIELTERRNLFVHANGVVSSQYLRVCKEHNVSLDEDIQVGKELDVSREYFIQAYKCIYEIGVKLAQVLWRKQHPEDLLAADKHLNKVTYELLREEKNKLAVTLLDFATLTLKKHFDGEQRRISVVNRAQAYKWVGNTEKATEIVESEDWSDTSIEFKLAQAVLKDDFVGATNLMEKIGSNGYPSKTDYKEWPLFKEFRKSEEFLKTYQELFGEEFKLVVAKEELPDDTSSSATGTSPTEVDSVN